MDGLAIRMKSTMKPFEPKPEKEYIQRVSNALWDVIMPSCTPAEWMIVSFVYRQTVGYGRSSVELSYNDIMTGTGIKGRATISTGIKGLTDKKYIIQAGKARGKMTYGLNSELDIETKTSSEIEPDESKLVQKLNCLSSEIELDDQKTSSEIEPDQSRLNNNLLKDNFKIPKGTGKKPASQSGNPETAQEMLNSVGRPKKKLMGTYLIETGTSMPKKKSEQRYWWSEVGELLNIVDDDVDLGQDLVKKTIKMMRSEGLTIGSPKSIVKTFRSLAGTHHLNGSRQEAVSFD